MHIYAVIIGTEILNGRRKDKHFDFLLERLLEKGLEMYASFVIKDEKELIEKVYETIKNDPDSILFSFGGIGSTPDDLTREIAAKVFTDHPLERNEIFFEAIVEKFGKDAYPHRIHMADLPKGAKLLRNPINNMSGFYLQERFFFMPGFPQMSHPMVEDILQNILSITQKTKHRRTFKAQTSENELISLMQRTPHDIELSSLPILRENKREVELSLAGYDEEKIDKEFRKYIEFLKQNKIEYEILKSK